MVSEKFLELRKKIIENDYLFLRNFNLQLKIDKKQPKIGGSQPVEFI